MVLVFEQNFALEDDAMDPMMVGFEATVIM
jgi:hypothetical protein